MKTITTQAIQQFLAKHQLDCRYADFAQKWFTPIIDAIAKHQNSAKKVLLIGINGCQGSGKSTLADYIVSCLCSDHQLSAISVSLDDFYLTHQKRAELAEQIHPLLATRGVPGTHDMELMVDTLNALTNYDMQIGTPIPRFDKNTDNPTDPKDWHVIDQPIDVVIFEGWCVGVNAQTSLEVIDSINALEQEYDTKGNWRSYVNNALRTDYQKIYDNIDIMVMLQAPSFDTVFNWRLEQEQKLAATISNEKRDKLMNEQQIQHFIQHFQRLTEHALKTLPSQCHYALQFDHDRNIIACNTPLDLPLLEENQR